MNGKNISYINFKQKLFVDGTKVYEMIRGYFFGNNIKSLFPTAKSSIVAGTFLLVFREGIVSLRWENEGLVCSFA